MNNLENLPKKQGLVTRDTKLSNSILVAFERTGTTPFNIDNMVTDIESEFKYLPTDELIKAIRNGGLGAYGITYKLTTQSICFWIREYIKAENKNRYV